MFTIFNGYVLKPFDVRDPHALFEVEWMSQSGLSPRFTWAEYQALRDERASFSDVVAASGPSISRVEGHRSYVLLVSGNFFRMLGVEAAVGRVLEPGDAAVPGGEAVAVISYAFWQRQWGGDPGVIARTMIVQGVPCEIVGVARRGFDGLDLAPPTDVWIPVTLARRVQDGADLFGPAQPRRLTLVGRLRSDVGEQTATAQLLLWLQNATRALPPDDHVRSVWLTSRATSIPVSPMMLFALSPVVVAFALVLLIACANVANMMLARGVARQRELGIRLTLGAGRRRLVTQLLTESVLLALPAAMLGFVVSRLVIDAGVRIMFATFPPEFAELMRVAPLPPDARVFAFMIGAAVATSVLFGLAPALQATREGVVQMARGDFGSDFRPARLRHALVVVQITAAVTLLITAAVLVRCTQQFAAIDPGIRTRDIVTLDVRDQARDRIVAALGVHPLVASVAAASTIPLDAMAPGVGAIAAGRSDLVRLRYRYVSPSFFETIDVALLGGRLFTAEEAESGAAVALLSETAAARLWPRGDAVGAVLRLVPDRQMKSTQAIARYETVRVIGVTRDTSADVANDGPLRATIYLPSRLAAAQLFASRLRLLQVFDLRAYGVGELIVLGACLAAACLPALRATRINPMTTLRAD